MIARIWRGWTRPADTDTEPIHKADRAGRVRVDPGNQGLTCCIAVTATGQNSLR